MNDNRNMILAVVLSALVLFGLELRLRAPISRPPTRRSPRSRRASRCRCRSRRPSPPPTAPQAIRDRAIVLRETPRRRDRDAAPRRLDQPARRPDRRSRPHHRARDDRPPNSPPIRLFSPAGAPGSYFAEFGWTGAGGAAVPDADTVWQRERRPADPGDAGHLSWDNGQGQIFEIVLSVDDGYLFTRRAARRSTAAPAPVAARPYSPGQPGRRLRRDVDSWTVHVGPMGVFNGTADYDNNFATSPRPASAASTAMAAGSASPTNIGWPR